MNIDDVIPNLVVKDTDVRAEGGIDGGEKNENRGRLIPLHSELLHLGFLDYVRALRVEGHKELFPELYLNKVRVAGHQSRNIVWRYMSDWLGLHMTIPANPASGKKADMYSIRSLGSSFYAQATPPT